jgi:hypothetical protein
MQPFTCWAVQPGVSVVSLLRMIAGRLAARRTAWYSTSPNSAAPALAPPVAVASVGAGLPSGPITFGSQS